MRTIISLLLLFVFHFFAVGQRVSYDDPDLTFSFKKPKNWEVFDNGYVVKLSPSVHDTSNTYFTITYFEDASPLGVSKAPEIMQPEDYTVTELPTPNVVEVGKYELQTGTTRAIIHQESYHQQRYLFNNYNQRWEIITSAPESEKKKYEVIFKRVIKSLRITQN
ncbi:hypothetical protein [Ekhidna sp.]|uniref:hypothetical protein n=1 Tax=Ekhidna sp. TaxID=2608089 RepID=UPI003CCBE3B5